MASKQPWAPWTNRKTVLLPGLSQGAKYGWGNASHVCFNFVCKWEVVEV